MVKVSVVMPVYNAERFLKDSIESILNQSLDDLELICVDDGSTDNSLDILNEFTEKDTRVKVFSRLHEGGGNARNYGLGKVTGEYLFCMDADDTLDLNAFEDFYEISKDNNLDFLVFKAINYGVEKDHFFETEYQNMPTIAKKVQDNIFNYKDLGDLLFDMNVSPWCKFYNVDFIKKTEAQFRQNSKFHDNQFFWDIIFQAERIRFIDKFYYTRKRYDDSLTASGDKNHINIIGVVNDIIKLFKKHNQLETYKNKLYNLKITWIIDRYNQIQDKYKQDFFEELHNDLINSNIDFEAELTDDNLFIFNNAKISKIYSEFDLLNQMYDKKHIEEITFTRNAIKDCIELIRQNKIEIDRLNSENVYLLKQNAKLKKTNRDLQEELDKGLFKKIFSKK